MVAKNDGREGKHGLAVTNHSKKRKKIRARAYVVECEGRTGEQENRKTSTLNYACTQTVTPSMHEEFRPYRDLSSPGLIQRRRQQISACSVRLAGAKVVKLADTGSWPEDRFSTDPKSCG